LYFRGRIPDLQGKNAIIIILHGIRIGKQNEKLL